MQTSAHPVTTTAPQVQEPAPAPPPAPKIQLPPPPFPAVEQIASGSHETAITSKYGDPALSAVISSGGHMIETFVLERNHKLKLQKPIRPKN
jgi:hypothetical protein